jgi:hypothetical protein
VKLIRAGKAGHVFRVGRREQELLFEMLKLYPLVPASHHQLSRQGKDKTADEDQHLLETALAEQRQENRKQVLAMLNDPQFLKETKSGFELSLSAAQIEWLLQVLNDVRVGSWLALGEPEQGAEPEVNEQNARYLIALELCGMFQSVLLAGLGVSESPEWIGD